MGFLGSIYWNSFAAVSLRNAVVFFLRKECVWFDCLKQIQQMSRKTDLQAETKDECVNKSMSSHLLHPALAFCRYCALKSWLFLLLCAWDFIICYNVQDKDYL